MDFTLTLIISTAVSSLALILGTHFINEHAFNERDIKNNRFLVVVRLVLIFVLCVLVISSISKAGERSQLWFITQTISIGIVTTLMLIKKMNSLDILATPILITSFTSVAIISAQGTPIIGTDQWRDLVASQSIVMDGNYWRASAFLTPYYQPAPVLAILIATLGITTGLTLFSSYTILTIIFPLLMVVALYTITYKIIKDRMALVAASLLILSNPMLYSWMVINLVFASLLSLILFNLFLRRYERINSPSTRESICALLLLFTTAVIAHAATAIAIFSVVIAIGLPMVTKVIRRKKERSNLYSLLKLLLLMIIILLTYWVYTIIFEWIMPLISVIIPLPPSSGSTVPALQAQHVEVALSYSIPVAFTLAYIYLYLLRILNKHSHAKEERTVNTILTLSAIMGGVLLFLGFVDFYKYGAWSNSRFIGTPGYLLLFIPSAISFSLLVRRGKLWVKILAISLGLLMLYSGSHSVGWAPDQYNAATTRYHDIHSQEVALSLVKLISDGSIVTAVRGVDDPFYEVSALYGKHINVNLKFMNLLYSEKSSELIPEQVIEFVRPNQLLILDTDTINPLLARYPQASINIYYTSGQYNVISGN